MADQALKKKPMLVTTLSSGVALGIWGAPSGQALPALRLSKTEMVTVIEDQEAEASALLKKLDKPPRRPSEYTVPAEVLNESLD